MNILRFGRLAIYLGAILVLSGMAVGFGALFKGLDAVAIPFLGLVPLGILLSFTGLTVVVLHEPRR